MSKPRLLDLFCGAGGCTKGYQRAGFYVVGVDSNPQPNYCGDEFFQADAMTFPLDGFDVIHASPPCQAFTTASRLGNVRRSDHPELIGPIRERLIDAGVPYVIENVVGALSELKNPYQLCGSSLGLVDLERHRLFETPVALLVPPCAHGLRGKARFPGTPRSDGSRPPSRVANVMASGISHAVFSEAMGIDWIPTNGFRPNQELRNAIPPAYTEFIGEQLISYLRENATPVE